MARWNARLLVASACFVTASAAGATSFDSFTSVGTVLWTAPYTTTYTFDVLGAAGGSGNTGTSAVSGGQGASVFGDFSLNAGDQFYLTIGGQGGDAYVRSFGGGGGGGASAVSRTDHYLMLVAGGGGGGGNKSGYDGDAGQAGSNGTTTGNATPGFSGDGGNGGMAYDDRDALTQLFFPTTVSSAAGGSGILTTGGDGAPSQANLKISTAQGGIFPYGGAGATPPGGAQYGAGAGGYGGGGGGDYEFGGGGGGGGGYSGGAGGDSHYLGNAISGFYSNGAGGGGGGSYIAAAADNQRAYSGVHGGDGAVVISFDFTPPPPPPPPPASVPEPSSWAMLVVGFGLFGAFLRRRRMSGAEFGSSPCYLSRSTDEAADRFRARPHR